MAVRTSSRPQIEITRSIRQSHRVYRISSGAVVPSVTSITSRLAKVGLTGWAFRLGQEHPELESIDQYVADLARIGSLAHHTIESRLLGAEPALEDWTPNEITAAAPPVKKFDTWMQGKDVRVVGIEMPLVSEIHAFGGTLDVLADIDGRRALCDIKTSRGIFAEHLYQTSAYAELLRENGERVDEIRILRVGRTDNDSLEERRVLEWDAYWRVFLALLALYRAEKTAQS
jgi:hypothetical protein